MAKTLSQGALLKGLLPRRSHLPRQRRQVPGLRRPWLPELGRYLSLMHLEQLLRSMPNLTLNGM